MQIRPPEDLTRDELIALIIRERGEAEHIGAGGVSLMGDAKDAEIARLREALRWNAAVLQSLCNGSISEASTTTIASETKRIGEVLDMARASLTQQEQT